VPPSSGQEPTRLGQVDGASPYLRSPAPTQGWIYKPNNINRLRELRQKYSVRLTYPALCWFWY
jgi:hypothetical protein